MQQLGSVRTLSPFSAEAAIQHTSPVWATQLLIELSLCFRALQNWWLKWICRFNE